MHSPRHLSLEMWHPWYPMRRLETVKSLWGSVGDAGWIVWLRIALICCGSSPSTVISNITCGYPDYVSVYLGGGESLCRPVTAAFVRKDDIFNLQCWFFNYSIIKGGVCGCCSLLGTCKSVLVIVHDCKCLLIPVLEVVSFKHLNLSETIKQSRI